ncbi:MAG TPA: phosphonate metabolism protein/1,5-bisphosphokinase (PRPP-forming) PhnN [Rhizobiaceae bacterium]|nr:phosphonate metabolism protein/1,5-bisphosphokinase (PRPP-forming) PhnN [Rhizobiaceae bacterium]
MSAQVAALAEPDAQPIGNGVFIAVVGPSGAGKDSVIHFAQNALAGDERVHFVRRVITRPSDPDAEDHDTLEEAEFIEAERDGAFTLSWQAHGLHYGLPASVDGRVADGAAAIANLSRNAIPALHARYANVIVAEITASPEILADRLSARGRESRGEVLARLARSAPLDASLPGVVKIDNSGALEIAGARFVAMVREALSQS